MKFLKLMSLSMTMYCHLWVRHKVLSDKTLLTVAVCLLFTVNFPCVSDLNL